MKTALLSVYNKDGIVEFAKELIDQNFKIYASGGTAKTLVEAGVEAVDIASLAGGGAILGHRVVTLSREIYAGLLSRETEEDRAELAKLKIPRIDLVCVDLYPLEEAIKQVQGSRDEVQEAQERIIDMTDIGGPTLLRAAAKGRRIVICDPADRQRVIDWLKNGEPNREPFLSTLAAKAEMSVANYVLISAKYHSQGKYDGIILSQISECKYGENPWQAPAGLYTPPSSPPILGGEIKGGYDALSLANFKLVSGTAPSYNNWADIDRLLQTLTHIAAVYDVNYGKVPYMAVGVKHGNSCGAAIEEDPSSAIKKMLEGDLRAIFGGVVMTNFELDEKLAEVLLIHRMENNQRRLLDGIIAPSFTTPAIDMLRRKGDKCRFLVNPALATLSHQSLDKQPRFRYVRGGFLRQPNYTFVLDFKEPKLVKIGQPTYKQHRDLLLAWAIGSISNSNTITLVKDRMLIGNGVGQQDRVGGCLLAVKRAKDAGHDTAGAVAYSDSFFPFVDGLEILAQAGIASIFATSGSVRDEEIKKFCKDHNISLVMLPDAMARGFFGH